MLPCQKKSFFWDAQFILWWNLATCVFWPRLCLATAAEKQNVGRDSSPHIISRWLDIKKLRATHILIAAWWLTAEQVKKTTCHHHMWSGSAFSNTSSLNYRLSNPKLNHRLGALLLLPSPWLRKWIHHHKMAVLKWLKRYIWPPVAINLLAIAILIDLIEYITPVGIPQDSVYFCS